MAKAVIIFDSKGYIWAVNYGEANVPQGVKAMLVDIPENVQSIDGVDVEHGEKPIFSYIPQAQSVDFDNKISAFMAKLTDMTNALSSATMIFAENLTDEQALRVPDYYPEWSGDGVSYKKHDRVRYRGDLWKVLTPHRSQENWQPTFSPSLFVKVLNREDGSIPEWSQPTAENAFMKGDTVSKNGVVYKSLVDNNIWEPGIAGTETLWEVVGE